MPDRNIQKFLEYVKETCCEHGIRFKSVDEANITLTNKEVVAGYFSDSPPILAVASGGNEIVWVATLVHEFSHLQQFLEHDPTYGGRYGNSTADRIVKKWMGGHDYKERTVERCLDIQKQCELNCERRAVTNIRKFDLPLDIAKYSQSASAYVHYFNYMKLTRRWNPPNGKFPTEIDEILEMMPLTLRGKYDRMSKKMTEMYDRHLGYC